MNIKPILMGTPMAQALAAGRKTQTRRTKGLEEINKDPDIYKYQGFNNSNKHVFARMWNGNYVESKHAKPQFNKGDILWVRETWFPTRWDFKDMLNRGLTQFVKYKADGDYDPKTDCVGRSWKPSIHMPKIACRTFLEVTNVRAERLPDISEEDAIAEGIEIFEEGEAYKDYLVQDCGSFATARGSFFSLWYSIHGVKSLEKNPWLWVYEFKEVERPKKFLD